jgi:hypothetical protein
MSSAMISQRPRRTCLTSPPGTPRALRQAGLFSSRVTGGQPPSASRGAPLKAASKGAKRSAKVNKRAPSGDPTSHGHYQCAEGDNDKDPDDSDEELIAATERNFKR